MKSEEAFKLAYPALADPGRMARDIQARLEAKGLEHLTGVDAVKAAYPPIAQTCLLAQAGMIEFKCAAP
jgi:hypothetical protein